MKRYSTGDLVKLKKGSRYYNSSESEYNPKNTRGVVYGTSGDTVGVEWKGGLRNTYTGSTDLEDWKESKPEERKFTLYKNYDNYKIGEVLEYYQSHEFEEGNKEPIYNVKREDKWSAHPIALSKIQEIITENLNILQENN